MTKPKLTVLTDPVPTGQYFFVEKFKNLLRPVKWRITRVPERIRNAKYRGHFAVTRSLVEGLEKIGVSASYNPRNLEQVAEVVVVLSGLDALKQAIGWKRSGRIKRLLSGPNLVVFPSDARDLIAAPEVDLYITPCELTDKMYVQDCPELQGRTAIWPAGVDTDYWCPSADTKSATSVLIFEKTNKGTVTSINDYISVIKRLGYHVNVIVYGNYSFDQYLRLLQQSCLIIGFAASESQGIAWAEAWSTDVPTLLWYQDLQVYRGRKLLSSTAPYLSAETGLFFRSLGEFETTLKQWEASKRTFHPRQWVLENMSDEVCARRLCRLAGIEF